MKLTNILHFCLLGLTIFSLNIHAEVVHKNIEGADHFLTDGPTIKQKGWSFDQSKMESITRSGKIENYIYFDYELFPRVSRNKKRSHPRGCFMYGPYEDFTGPGSILGSIDIKHLKIWSSSRKALSKRKGEVLFWVDIAANAGTRLAKQEVTVRQYLRWKKNKFNGASVTLSYKSDQDLDRVEIRLCGLNKNFGFILYSPGSELIFNYDYED